MGEPPDRLRAPIPSNFAKATVGRVKGIQAHYWSSMLPKPIARPSQAERLHGMRQSLQLEACKHKKKKKKDLSTRQM